MVAGGRGRTPRSVVHSTAVLGIWGIAFLLEFGDRLVDTAGVPTNDA